MAAQIIIFEDLLLPVKYCVNFSDLSIFGCIIDTKTDACHMHHIVVLPGDTGNKHPLLNLQASLGVGGTKYLIGPGPGSKGYYHRHMHT